MAKIAPARDEGEHARSQDAAAGQVADRDRRPLSHDPVDRATAAQTRTRARAATRTW